MTMAHDATTTMHIKLLNWKAPSLSNFWTNCAKTPFGTYSIERTKAHYQVILEGPGGSEKRIDKPTRDLAFARQLAQRDFDKRAFSLLTTAPREAGSTFHVSRPVMPAVSADWPDYQQAAE